MASADHRSLRLLLLTHILLLSLCFPAPPSLLQRATHLFCHAWGQDSFKGGVTGSGEGGACNAVEPLSSLTFGRPLSSRLLIMSASTAFHIAVGPLSGLTIGYVIWRGGNTGTRNTTVSALCRWQRKGAPDDSLSSRWRARY